MSCLMMKNRYNDPNGEKTYGGEVWEWQFAENVWSINSFKQWDYEDQDKFSAV